MKRIRRLIAFLAQEVLDIVRQPLLLLLLILGPFLILLLFGFGFTGRQEPVSIILVVPSDAQLPAEIMEPLHNLDNESFSTTTTEDNVWAFEQLKAGKADLVAIVPSKTQDILASGKQVEVQLQMNTVSPFRRDYLTFVGNRTISQINTALSRQTASEALETVDMEDEVSPSILAEPVVVTMENISRFTPTYMGFYAPAVLALLVQHIAITFAALSLVRDRLQGTNELFQVSPLQPAEALVGKFLSYLLLTLALALILTLLIQNVLGIPIYGNAWHFLLILALEIGASLGWGFFISAISQREGQAVQLSMILLLSSVFFGGFFLDLAGLLPAVRVVSYLMPVTYAIADFQTIMLAGRTGPLWYVAALTGLMLGLTFVAWLFYRRQFRLA